MRRRPVIALATALVATAALRAQPPRPAPADLIVTNARVHTVDDARPIAQALAVRDGRIAFVGDVPAALALRGPATRVLDLGGKTVIPGMVDAHGHLLGLGAALRTVDLTGTHSYDEVVARVAARAREVPAGTWIVGRGWDQNDWGDTRFPTHDALTRAVPNHPVYLERVDGHAGLVNAAAMRAAGVTAKTRDPEGGRVERDASGAPAGVFVDHAQALVERATPARTAAELRERVRAGA